MFHIHHNLSCHLLQSCALCFGLQYSPYKKGSKLTKARRAKALGLEVATSALMDTPHSLDLMAWVKPDTEGETSTNTKDNL